MSASIVVVILSLLLVTQLALVRATAARNIGALYLKNSSTADYLSHAEDWLTYSLALLENPRTHKLLGKVWQARGDITGAVQQWRDAGLTSFAVDVGVQELARANEIEAQMWQQELTPIISKPAEWQKLGVALEQREDYIEAIYAYQQAAALSTLDKTGANETSLAEIYYSLGRIYRTEFDDLPGAIEAYSAAVEVDDFRNPWHRVLSYQELAILLMRSDSERAVAAAQRAVELMPDSAMGHSILGLAIYAAYGDLEQAKQEIHVAIALDPQSAWPWMHLGQVYFQAQEYELAVNAYLEAAELEPDFKVVHDMAAFIRKTYLDQ